MKSRFTGRRLKNIFFSGFVIFLILQFFRPGIINPPVTADIQAPANVKEILRRSCYDCHSNETNLRWFDKVVPVYWKVRQHILEGRKGLNFSVWDSLSPAEQNAKLWEAVNQVVAGAMPLPDYELVHSGAKISVTDLQTLKNYLTGLKVVQDADSQRRNALVHQRQHLASYEELPIAPNGIPFIADYKNWQPVSATDRYDNGTLRIISGNEIACKAIREKNTNPWPDGTVFAKIAWDALADSTGSLETGAFKQVEFMIRDRKKYSSTVGWGFARFRTPAMVPYGKSAMFASECVNCHRPMKVNDYVFTIPLEPFSNESKDGNLKLISSWVNKKDSTMSIRYAHPDSSRSELVVTWKQRADPHWFGGSIPGERLSIDSGNSIKQNPFSFSHLYSILP